MARTFLFTSRRFFTACVSVLFFSASSIGFSKDAELVVTATVKPSTAAQSLLSNTATSMASWDIDGNGNSDALTDGLLVLRYLFGFRGDTLVNGAVARDAFFSTAATLEPRLAAVTNRIADIDGNGQMDALTDGLLLLRSLFGFSGNTLAQGATASNGSRTSADAIERYINDFMPPANNIRIGVWPISGKTTPDCLQDGFAHRILGTADDFHPGIDTCNDNAKDVDDISGNDNEDDSGFPIYATHEGIVSRVRLWDTAWDNDPSLCPSFCRQGNFILIHHPDLGSHFNNQTVQTTYLHMAQDSVSVQVGDVVNQGEQIGLVGKTGNNINTTHLHYGLLVGSAVGLIDADNYINPLGILSFSQSTPTLTVSTAADSSAFDSGECPAAETGTSTLRTLTIQLVENAPAIDTVRIEVDLNNGLPLIADINQRIGIGIDSSASRDDFQQGCIAFEVSPFSETIQTRTLNVHFGGNFDGINSINVKRVDVFGAMSTQSFSL